MDVLYFEKSILFNILSARYKEVQEVDASTFGGGTPKNITHSRGLERVQRFILEFNGLDKGAMM
jgi:hypothetical protein